MSIDRTEKGSSLLTFPDDYVVIDLETTGLDPQYDSIIEVAALRITGGAPAGEYTSLVNPGEELDPFITDLTGITQEMVDGAPALEAVLPQLLDFIGDATVVGHNVNFDINFIYDASEEILGKPFTNDFVDTMRISRRIYRQERHHRLCDLVERFGIGDSVEHRAMADVQQTNQCLQYMKGVVSENDLDIHKIPSDKRAKDIVAQTDSFDESSPIFGKLFVFTGALSKFTRAEAMQEVVNRGGQCADSVKKATDFLVMGCLDYCATVKDGKSAKRKKAESMKLKGSPIEIISENTFLDMLDFE